MEVGNEERRKMLTFSFPFDPLYCHEENSEEEPEETEQQLDLVQEDEEEEKEDEVWVEAFSVLLASEGETHQAVTAGDIATVAVNEAYLSQQRSLAVEWMVKASFRLGFSPQTAILAVSYLDRCFLAAGTGGGLRLQEDKPWMARLAAVACLSLAAKVEETHVPLLLDIQAPPAAALSAVEEIGYVFESRTIRRMELLVLSTLGWRMYPVTPLCLLHRLLPKLSVIACSRREIFSICEVALLNVISDCRWVQHPASVWAAAALLHSAKGHGDPGESTLPVPPYVKQSLDLLRVAKESAESGSRVITELTGGGHCCSIGHKRRHLDYRFQNVLYYSPSRSRGVICSCFSCESSSSGSDSLAHWLPPLKKPNLNPVHDNGQSKDLAPEKEILLA